jgi:hypothetical protein
VSGKNCLSEEISYTLLSKDHWTLHRVWKFERKARDYMAPSNLIQNVDEDKKDPFEKVDRSRKLVKKKRTRAAVPVVVTRCSEDD